jgi:hypothetical protein
MLMVLSCFKNYVLPNENRGRLPEGVGKHRRVA